MKKNTAMTAKRLMSNLILIRPRAKAEVFFRKGKKLIPITNIALCGNGLGKGDRESIVLESKA